MAPTKANSLRERMDHAFGRERIERSFQTMLARENLLDLLTDEARDELLRRCIASHKSYRQYAAESRANYKRRAS
jgi:predicted aminopeptidase